MRSATVRRNQSVRKSTAACIKHPPTHTNAHPYRRIGANSLRVKIMAPGNAISNQRRAARTAARQRIEASPNDPWPSAANVGSGIIDLTNGNLAVIVDAATGFVTTRRVSACSSCSRLR